MFTRRASIRPANAVLMAVPGVFIVDDPPPVPASSAPFGKICVVGEFEDGPFAAPTDLLTSKDQPTIFGGFGFTYGGQKNQYACALRSGGLEYWNGNGWVQTARLKFGALTFCRVDTSIGSVTMTPLAFIQGTKAGPWALDNGVTFIWQRDGVTRTATFAAAAAVKTSAAGTFTSFVGGEQVAIELNGAPAITVTFQAGDNTQAAIISRINAAFGFTFAANSAGQIALTSDRKGTGSSVRVLTGAPATTLGFNNTIASGTGDAVNIAQTTSAELAVKLQAVDAGTIVRVTDAGFPRIISGTGGTGTVLILAGTGNAALGFVDNTGGVATDSGAPADVTIGAGTRLRNNASAASRVVTMQSTKVTKGSKATVLLKVRPAVDDGTYAGVATAAINTLEDSPGGFEWTCGNPGALSAALTASQLDSAYLAAIDATKGASNDVTKRINGIVSARTSAAIRSAVKSNAVDASANGHFDRRAFVCPPNGTTAATAISSAAPGIGFYRAEEVSYAAGGVRCFLQEMIDGAYPVDSLDRTFVRHPDTMLASRWSVLPPGYNPGQQPENTDFQFDKTTFPGLEASAQSWDVNTYTAFEQAGVCGSEYDKDTGIVFSNGLTAVDPAVDPAKKTIARRTLAGFIGDTIAAFAKPRAKRQGTDTRREIIKDAITGFLDQLKAPNGDTVEDYSVEIVTDSLPAGAVEYPVRVKMVQSDDVFLINLSVGTTVTISR